MTDRTASRLPAHAMAIALLVIVASLGWEVTHGGVKSHHLLDRPDLPAISNAWGLLVLPALGALAGGVVARRLTRGNGSLSHALVAFGGALAMGAALSAAFTTGRESPTFALFMATLSAGCVLRTYRAEYVFGFVLGMTFVFGSVLPTLVAAVAASVAAVVHLGLRPAFGRALRRVRA